MKQHRNVRADYQAREPALTAPRANSLIMLHCVRHRDESRNPNPFRKAADRPPFREALGSLTKRVRVSGSKFEIFLVMVRVYNGL